MQICLGHLLRIVKDLLFPAASGSFLRLPFQSVGAIFAGLALVLAAIGIYGVIAYSVVQRTREIGIRMALGANRANVLRLILRQGARIGMLGLVIGTMAAYLSTRALAGMLYGVDPHDPLIFAAIAVSLFVVVVLASYIPARRATRVDPLIALRYE